MKPGVPAWSVVLVVPRGSHEILAVSRSFNLRDPALPGGDSEEGDQSPAETAQRVLYEETSLRAQELKCIDRWEGEREQPVFVFYVPKWAGKRLRVSDKGKPYWTGMRTLLVKTATFRDDAQRIFNTMGRVA